MKKILLIFILLAVLFAAGIVAGFIALYSSPQCKTPQAVSASTQTMTVSPFQTVTVPFNNLALTGFSTVNRPNQNDFLGPIAEVLLCHFTFNDIDNITAGLYIRFYRDEPYMADYVIYRWPGSESRMAYMLSTTGFSVTQSGNDLNFNTPNHARTITCPNVEEVQIQSGVSSFSLLYAEHGNQENVFVRFLDNANGVLNVLAVPATGYLTETPEWTGYMPPLYRFEGWQTKAGYSAEDEITEAMDFYPVMVKNFEYGDMFDDQDKKTVIYDKGKYNNSDLANDFANGMYKLPNDKLPAMYGGVQELSDPFLINEFVITGMDISSVFNNGTYFTFKFDTWQSSAVPTHAQHVNTMLDLSLSVFNGTVRLTHNYTTIEQIAFKDFTTLSSTFTFGLRVDGLRIRYDLEWKLPNKAADKRSGLLPGNAYRYDNSGEYFLGLQGLNIHPSAPVKGFPAIYLDGRFAKVEKPVKCYIEGEIEFTTMLARNHWERPQIPEEFEVDPATVEWYLDSNFTQLYLHDLHKPRDFNTLYGKRVTAQYYVTITYYTLNRFYAFLNGGKFYEALVQKSVTRVYTIGSMINLNDFGSNYYEALFYDNIKQISFQRWDEDITEPVTEDTVITGIYKFPTATIYYYDVDNKLYGTRTQALTIMPVDFLKHELDRLNNSNPNGWFHDVSESKGVLGVFVNFFDGILRFLFGTDAVTSGSNSAAARRYQEDTGYIINQLFDSHSKTSLYFVPVLNVDINLQDLNKGAYGNEAFDVDKKKNPQWNLIHLNIYGGQVVAFADVHSMYALGSSNFSFVVNFHKKMSGADSFAKAVADLFGWVGKFFGGIFGSLTGWIWVILGVILLIFCWPLVAALIKALFAIISWPFRWLGKKAGA